jgi:hypothetical protein|tara:strand:+ start:361 stop:534 length:174 start_codon:yes stop_codon:yes gene_type:complete
MSQAERAYKVLQQLTNEKEAPSGEDFDSWTLRVVEAIAKKISDLELKVAKLTVKGNK